MVEDFEWWQTARESTESSRSTIGFSHYMSQSHSKFLTSFQIKKLNLILRTGRPIECWKNAITVLIEKIRCNISFDKMRALQLFEADLNWIFKKHLSHKLMKKAREDSTLPEEAYAVAGTSATEATLTQILLSDTNRLQHKSHAIVSADLGQYYDSIAHVPCSLSLFKPLVPQES